MRAGSSCGERRSCNRSGSFVRHYQIKIKVRAGKSKLVVVVSECDIDTSAGGHKLVVDYDS
jgi:hypothetical protein